MAKKNEIIRHFKGSNSELVQLLDKLINAVERDFKGLSNFGLKQEKVDLTKKLRNEFVEFPTDEEVLADKTAITDKKNDALKNLREAMKAVLSRISLHFGKTSSEIKKAGGENVSDLTDAEMCQKGRRVERTGREYLETLKEAGLTEEILEQLKLSTNLFDDLIDEQKDTAVQRDLKTRERAAKANELYELAVKFSDLGKAAFDGKNPALLESYRLIDKYHKKNDESDESNE